MAESAGGPAEPEGASEAVPNLAGTAVDLALGVLAVGAAGLKAVPDLAAKLPVRAAAAALVASERAQQEYESLLVRGGEVRSLLSGFLAGRLLGPPIVDEDAGEPDPFDLLLLEDPSDEDDIDLPRDEPRTVPFVVVEPTPPPAKPKSKKTTPVPPPVEPSDDLPLDGFDAMTLGAMRAKARQLGVADLETLLGHERTHGMRSGVLSLLETRIAQLQQEQSAG
jgi:hypothetical protein